MSSGGKMNVKFIMSHFKEKVKEDDEIDLFIDCFIFDDTSISKRLELFCVLSLREQCAFMVVNMLSVSFSVTFPK